MADYYSIRGLWARARVFRNLPEVDKPEDAPTLAAVSPPPGCEVLLPHTGGLFINIEGELLPSFPVERHVDAIRKAQGPIDIRLNCGGGDLRSALELHEALFKAGPDRVTALVAGLCGSAATVILAACDTRRVLNGSRLWVHGPSDVIFGNAAALRAAAEYLEDLIPQMAAVYERICPPSLVSKWLSGPNFFFDAREAFACDLATEVVEPMPLEVAK